MASIHTQQEVNDMNEPLTDEQLDKALAKIRDADRAMDELTESLIVECDRLRVALRANDDARDKLERRLDAVLMLHANPELVAVHEGYGAEYRCNECRDHHWPCPTAKAAMSEAW